jgi:hypothetical protein
VKAIGAITRAYPARAVVATTRGYTCHILAFLLEPLPEER